MPTVTNLREWVMFILTLFIVPGLGALTMMQFKDGESTARLAQQTLHLARQVEKLEVTLGNMNASFQRVNTAQVACDIRLLQIKAELDELRAARAAK